MKISIISIFIILISFVARAQKAEEIVKNIFDEALTDQTAYENLRVLCKEYGGRITGSPEAERAVEYTYTLMQNMRLDSVYMQEVQVPRWIRGETETGKIVSKTQGETTVPITALGNSIGTGNVGLQAEIIEICDFDELKKVGRESIEGKIVFFNHPMDPTLLNTFTAYGKAASYRTTGAARASEYGAVAVVVRSLTNALDDYPHTGVMRYDPQFKEIPAVAISTNGAELLSAKIKEEPKLEFFLRTTCKNLHEVTSHNEIGEIRGSEFPDEIITVGGHLDAWDTGEGAHDDGTGCMQSIEVLRIFNKLNIRTKRTIRAVMFMDEEVAQRGGKEYANQAERKGEMHYFALEADRGGFMPLGFGVSGPEERVDRILKMNKYFEPYGITQFTKGGGGVDIGPLAKFGTPLASFVPEMQRYFYCHHSGFDTFEQVNFREFQLGSAAIASFIYLIDKNDL